MQRQVLIIQTAFTGDVVLALPLAQRVRAEWPDAHIHFLVRKGNENLVEHHPDIDSVWIWDKKHHKTANLFRLIQELRQIPFALVLNCQRFFSTGFLSLSLKAKEKRGFAENPLSTFYSARYPHTRSSQGASNALHEVDRNLSLLTGLMPTHREAPRLIPTEAEIQKVRSLLPPGQWVVMAPASVWFTKQWPQEKWVELIRNMPENMISVLIGGPGDFSLCEEIRKAGGKGINLCGKLTFRESAALMSLAHRTICNDSAPMHLASSVGGAVTGIFCSTIPEFGFYPLSPDSAILQETKDLSCRPCGLHGKKICPEGHFLCGTSIGVSEVLKTLE
jgi:heptosyltransferase-2